MSASSAGFTSRPSECSSRASSGHYWLTDITNYEIFGIISLHNTVGNLCSKTRNLTVCSNNPSCIQESPASLISQLWAAVCINKYVFN